LTGAGMVTRGNELTSTGRQGAKNGQKKEPNGRLSAKMTQGQIGKAGGGTEEKTYGTRCEGSGVPRGEYRKTKTSSELRAREERGKQKKNRIGLEPETNLVDGGV